MGPPFNHENVSLVLNNVTNFFQIYQIFGKTLQRFFVLISRAEGSGSFPPEAICFCVIIFWLLKIDFSRKFFAFY
jgi:hypothetical protein